MKVVARDIESVSDVMIFKFATRWAALIVKRIDNYIIYIFISGNVSFKNDYVCFFLYKLITHSTKLGKNSTTEWLGNDGGGNFF